MENKLSDLETSVGYQFKNTDLLETVVTHRSYLNEHRNTKCDHNERLEFLGDAVLELVVTEYLYRKYSDPEGVLTSWRSALVRGTSLSEVGHAVKLDRYMRMSHGQEKAVGKSMEVIYANAVEALIGALYLDGGIAVATNFINKHIIGKLEDIIKKGNDRDAKSLLQEIVQEKLSITPQYKVLEESGPDHDKKFVSGVYFNNNKMGEGVGASKREAEQAAALDALNKVN